MVLLADGIRNPYLDDLDDDYLYHLGLSKSMDLEGMFRDVKYVCMGGSSDRTGVFAEKAARELGIPVPEGGLEPIGKTERTRTYKVGPILFLAHGMGMPSTEIFLNETAKLLHYAGCEDVSFIRVGTSGGYGVEGGTVVVTEEALDGQLRPQYDLVKLGQVHSYPTKANEALVAELMETAKSIGDRIKVVMGKTIGADGFYEHQARLDGALNPGYTPEEKMAFLNKAYEAGARNNEMEGPVFLSFCLRAGIPAAIVCAALLNRLNGDQVPKDAPLEKYSDDAQLLVIEWIRRRIAQASARSHNK